MGREKPQLPPGEEYRHRHVKILISHLILYIPITVATTFIPSTAIDNVFLLHRLHWGKLVFWMFLMVSGFIYVSHATHQRTNVLYSRYEGRKTRDFRWLLLFGLVSFFTTATFTLSSTQDVILTNMGNPEADFVPKQWWRVSIHNYCFALCYYLALHFFFLDQIEILHQIGNKIVVVDRWNQMNKKEVVALIAIVVFILALASFQVYWFAVVELLWWYLLGYGIFFFFIVIISCIIKKSYYFHAHHYFMFGVLTFGCRNLHPMTVVSLAIVMGITVEGIATWGCALWWNRRRVLPG